MNNGGEKSIRLPVRSRERKRRGEEKSEVELCQILNLM